MSREANRTNSRERPGKFGDINCFIDLDDEALDEKYRRQFKYKPASQVGPCPGMIIYVDDKKREDSRIDQRVMLIFRVYTGGKMQCVSFCLHDPPFFTPEEQDTHLQVVSCQPAATSELATIEASLLLGKAKLGLCPDISINLQEIWFVDYDVRVAVLGKLTTAGWLTAWSKIKEL
ncbi:hypothetical protein LTR66_017863, partial [Elasticomyces elasticus]